MSRLWTLMLSVVFLAGCQSRAPMQNPFFGPTTVPPPGTGMTTAPPAAPYYQGAPPPAQLPSVPQGGQIPSGTLGAPPTAMPPLSTGSTPPAATQRMKVVSSGPQQNVIGGTTLTRGRWAAPAVAPRPPVAAQTSTESPAGQVAPAAYSVASVPQWSVVRVGEQQRAAVAEEEQVSVETGNEIAVDENGPHAPHVAEIEPARFQPEGDVVEIGQLPPARPSQVRSASYATPADEKSSRSVYAVAHRPTITEDAVEPAHNSVFGHDPQYRWVKGQLEYSEVGRRWKLRYIPIDGATDDNGGSVLLPDGTEMGNLKPGDYVTIYGQLGDHEENSKGFAPLYYADRVEPIE